MNVLIVEDEMLVACDLEATIEDLGHTIVGLAPDSATALELAARHPDLALVDLNLRDGETGPQVGKTLCEMGIGVIFVTGNPRALGLGVEGALGVFTKPMDHSAVEAILIYASQVLAGDQSAAVPTGLHTFNDASR